MSLKVLGINSSYGNGQIVACFGGHKGSPDDPMYDAMKEVGRLLAKQGYIVASGAYGGMMTAVSQGAKEGDGLTIGFTIAANQPINSSTKLSTQKNSLPRSLFGPTTE